MRTKVLSSLRLQEKPIFLAPAPEASDAEGKIVSFASLPQ